MRAEAQLLPNVYAYDWKWLYQNVKFSVVMLWSVPVVGTLRSMLGKQDIGKIYNKTAQFS